MKELFTRVAFAALIAFAFASLPVLAQTTDDPVKVEMYKRFPLRIIGGTPLSVQSGRNR